MDPAGQPALKTEERKVSKWYLHALFLSDPNSQARAACDLPMVLFTESTIYSCLCLTGFVFVYNRPLEQMEASRGFGV